MERYCTHCGKPLRADMLFCTECGSPVQQGQASASQGQIPAAPKVKKPADRKAAPAAKKKSPVRAVLLAVFALAFAAAAVLIYFGLTASGLNRKYQALRSEIESRGIPAYAAAADAQEPGWKQTGAFSLSARREIVKAMTDIAAEAKQAREDLDRQSGVLDGFRRELEGDSSDSAAALRRSLDAWEAAIRAGDCSQAARLEADCTGGMITVRAGSDPAPAVPPAATTEPPVTEPPATEHVTEPPVTAPPATETEDVLLTLAVQQADLHSYPVVSLYLRITDPAAGGAAAGLNRDDFRVDLRDSYGSYSARSVDEACMLEGRVGLKTVLVADVSDSMAGTRLDQAEEAMCSFLRGVSFSDGDQVELLSFGSGINLIRGFTADRDQLNRDVQNLWTDGNSCLYNALYMAICRAACQSGPRCVIAYTDSPNVYEGDSGVDADQVTELAKRYGVPVFVVGFGDANDSALRRICSESGGWYRRIDSPAGLSPVFDEIYRQEKGLYLVRFLDRSGAERPTSLQASVEIDGEYCHG
ncbi:MAG: VWA domain-containing protein, partial [Oscillospiraceae bacterium]|nr:VWA domain-containing protein [Oscillospiraceae bacterium]